MKNAYIGYSYQKHVTSLFLAKMDVDRDVESIEIEADVDGDFDDLVVRTRGEIFHLQIKDFDDVSLDSLTIKQGTVTIGGKKHKLSKFSNVIFFRYIDIRPESQVFGIPCQKLGNVHIVSLSREGIDDQMAELYNNNRHRYFVIEKFLSGRLDSRMLRIERKDLPVIPTFDTRLIEPTIDVGRTQLKVGNILIIEGKPGVGKSHLVNCLAKEYPNNILYRFWISSQDKEYDQRLKYANFLFDFSKKLYNDQVPRTEDQILARLWSTGTTVIIDGLDHVESYNPSELTRYLTFIQKLQTGCKTIVLTRPIKKKLQWEKHELVNWNDSQTRKVLDELFHITDYQVCSKIYTITDGYPILVKYLAEHYKEHRLVPEIHTLSSVDEYYNEVFGNKVKTKRALTLFLCCHSFYTRSEIEFFLGGELAAIIMEFVDDYPYLFERRLNRISLLHDSFNTYLRRQKIDYEQQQRAVNQKVYASILNLERQFLSRFGFFDFDPAMKKEIVSRYASISVFERIMHGVVDFEAIRSFYEQLRECVAEMPPKDFKTEEYYELALIINLVYRDHISGYDRFLVTYIKTMLLNGYTAEDITSSGYLFAMLHFVQTGSADLLLNLSSDSFHDTSRFFENLQSDVREEEDFFSKHRVCLSKQEINKLLVRDTEHGFQTNLTYVLENLFVYEKHRRDFPELANCILGFIESEDANSVRFLEHFIQQRDVRYFFARWILNDAKKNLLALGHAPLKNDYLNLSLSSFIEKNRQLRSNDLCIEILNYMRLALRDNRAIDLSNIYVFWTRFYHRKDYTLLGVPAGLHVFEKKGYITQEQSVRLITSIQAASEKGYRRLLADYIELHSARVIDFLLNNFDTDELHIAWLSLPARYINRLPDGVFHGSLKDILTYHRSTKQIDLHEVDTIIQSNRREDFRQVLGFTGYSVRVLRGSRQVTTLRKRSIPVTEYDDETKAYKHNSEQRFASGIITSRDRNVILAKKLRPEVLAGFADGNHATLSDVSLFRVFDEQQVKRRIRAILHNAFVGKVHSINSFQYLYYFPGNVVQLLVQFGIEVDYKKYFRWFKTFLELSMFRIPAEQEEKL